jgi:hypothetical protein
VTTGAVVNLRYSDATWMGACGPDLRPASHPVGDAR